MKKARASLFLRIGLGSEKDYLVDNLSVLLNAGMDILAALEAIASETKSGRLRKLVRRMVEDVENGEPVWRALYNTGLFQNETISLVRIGEDSGRLIQNLQILALQSQKDRMFRSKIVGAMAYPAFVVGLGSAVGFWVLFFLLPQLATTFSSLNMPLPFVTRALIAVGEYTRDHWAVLIPSIMGTGLVLGSVCFAIPKTRFIGQFFLLRTPAIGRLLIESETGRIGYLLGTLLSAGVDLIESLRSVSHASSFSSFSKFFSYLADRLEEGGTFEQAFQSYGKTRKVLSVPMQQLIVTAEHSGTVSQAFLSIGELYQFKADVASKNLTVILEPLLLLVMGVGVLFLALAVVMPIYSLVGGIE